MMTFRVLKNGLEVSFEHTDEHGEKLTTKSDSLEANLLYEILRGLQSVDTQLSGIEKKFRIAAVRAAQIPAPPLIVDDK
jgi:hypothetical protein